MIIPPWVRLLIAAGALCGAFGSGWYVNGMRHENAALRADAGRQEALNKAVDKERDRADRYSQQVVDLLQATPQPSERVREIIRNVKSDCILDPEVISAINRSTDDANARISGKGLHEMQADD